MTATLQTSLPSCHTLGSQKSTRHAQKAKPPLLFHSSRGDALSEIESMMLDYW